MAIIGSWPFDNDAPYVRKWGFSYLAAYREKTLGKVMQKSDLLIFESSTVCTGTQSGKHVLEYEGEDRYWCRQCGKVFEWQYDDEGYWRLNILNGYEQGNQVQNRTRRVDYLTKQRN